MNKTVKKSLPIFLATVMAISGGCASKSQIEAIESRAMRDRQESRQRIVELENELTRSKQALQTEIQKSNNPVRSNQANMWAEVNGLRTQVAILQGRLDNVDRLMGASNSTITVEELAGEVEAIRFALKHQMGLEIADSTANTSKTIATQPAALASSETPQAEPVLDPAKALYDRARKNFEARNYEDAQRDWAEFATTFKKNPLVSNAIFWQGECFFQLQDYGNAILTYQDVIAKYPKSNKYRVAKLKQGMSFYKLGKKTPGRAVLQSIIDTYPKSTEALRAKKYIESNQ
ncbi:MAG: tol-pal system protein YbgF [Desulfovibrio sp.]